MEEAPSAEGEDDGLAGGTGDSLALSRHGRRDGRVAADKGRGPVTATGELYTWTTRSVSERSLAVDREGASHGVRSPARALFPTEGFAVSKPAYTRRGGLRRSGATWRRFL